MLFARSGFGRIIQAVAQPKSLALVLVNGARNSGNSYVGRWTLALPRQLPPSLQWTPRRLTRHDYEAMAKQQPRPPRWASSPASTVA